MKSINLINMKFTIRTYAICGTICFLSIITQSKTSFTQIVYEIPKKKLIDFGWHSPFVQDLKERMQEYETGPFDGVGIKLSMEAGNGNVFMVDNWKTISTETKDREKKLISSIRESPILTDNFLVLYGASQMDWFSDDDWAKVIEHLRFAAQMAKAARCKGIIWDPEPYKPGKNPWKYKEQEKSTRYSFEQYYNQTRKRGARFIQTLQEEFPGIIVFSLRELSEWQNGSPFSGALLPVINQQNTIQELENAWWGLHVPFYAGILDAIHPDVKFIDGNEEAYYYTSALEYYRLRGTLRDDAKALIPPELREKYATRNEIAHSISVDYIAGNWLGLPPFPYRLTGQSVMMTAEEKIKWFEHNAYYALRTADEYAWLYTEDMNWWTGEKVPEGFRGALLRAKHKVATGQPLGYEIDQMIKAAQDKAEVFYKDKRQSNISGPRNFIFFDLERKRISEPGFLENEFIAGAQLKYTWRELEPERDRYRLQPLLDDLAFLEKHGKRLFVQLQDVSFSEEVYVPDYIRTDPAFGGGVARKYEVEGDDESKAKFDGWVARRWDPAVRGRFSKLLEALGGEVDGRIEGLNLPETSIGFGESGRLHPAGFTYESYLEGVKEIMTAALKAFPRSCVIQYANFMPGEWLPWTDHGYLRAVYAHAEAIGAGVGGPDLLPHRKGQQNHSYPLIAARGSKIPAGVAVQDGNLEDRNPATGDRVTVMELYRFAKDRLRLDYIYWGTQEPYYSEQVVPFIRGLAR